MSTYIEPSSNLSEAWLRTLEHVADAGGHEVNVLTTITDPLAAENEGIRSVLDELLTLRGESSECSRSRQWPARSSRVTSTPTPALPSFPAWMRLPCQIGCKCHGPLRVLHGDAPDPDH